MNSGLLLACLAVYAANRFGPATGQGAIAAVRSSYLSDFLAMPVMLAYANWILANARGATREITRVLPVLAASVVCGLVWELAVPVLRQGSVADPVDLAAYVLGGVCYSLIARRALRGESVCRSAYGC